MRMQPAVTAGVVLAAGAMAVPVRAGCGPALLQSYRVDVKNDDPFVLTEETGCSEQEKRGGNPPVPCGRSGGPCLECHRDGVVA